MKTILLMFLLACVSSGVLAEWKFLIATDQADWYVNESLTRKRGMMAKVWTLQQYATSQPLYSGEYLSAKMQAEVRCYSRQWRVFYFSYYTGRMGSGKLVYTHETAGSWKSVTPDSFSDALFQVGCHPEENQALDR